LTKISKIINGFYGLVGRKEKARLKLDLPLGNLKLGQGSGSLATSLWLLVEHMNLEDENERKELENRYFSKWKVSKYDGEPKTHKLVRWKNRNWTMGWCKWSWKS